MANKGRAEAGKALEAARVAETEAASHRPTAAQKQKQIAELEERAQLFGDPVKQSAQAKVFERKWLRFLLVHAEEYSFTACAARTTAKHFVKTGPDKLYSSGTSSASGIQVTEGG